MAMIYNIKCSPKIDYTRTQDGKLKKEYSKSCDFIIKDYKGPDTYVKMDDGSEQILPEPYSDNTLEGLTGKTFKQLLKDGRIISKDHKFCMKCFKRETGNNMCECEEPKLVKIATLEEGSLCPKCRIGHLKKIPVGIS